MRIRTALCALLLAGAASAVGLGFYFHKSWRSWVFPAPPAAANGNDHDEPPDHVHLSPQAQANLRLVVRPIALTSHWRSITVPGMVTELPGRSDHGVTSPVAGVVRRIAVMPWQTVRPGDELYTLGLVSEFLQHAQAELFKTARDVQINQEERMRLADASRTGVVPAARTLELDYQQRRLAGALSAYRHQLAVWGLTPTQIDAVAEGRFVTELTIRAPATEAALPSRAYEVQELKVNLGEQVQPGQLLCYLTDHQALAIEGRGFRQEVPLLERAAQQGWLVRAEFPPDESGTWLASRPELAALVLAGLCQPGCVVPLVWEELLPIRFLANTVDPASQTYPFYLALTNPYREHASGGKTYRTWRYRPGQRVLLHVPVEEFHEVFVLPASAVVRKGAETYVFRQDDDHFERKPVHVVHSDRRFVVLANDGSVRAGDQLAHNAAAQLNFALKAQAAESGDHHHHDH